MEDIICSRCDKEFGKTEYGCACYYYNGDIQKTVYVVEELEHCFDTFSREANKEGRIRGEYGSSYDLTEFAFIDNEGNYLTKSQVRIRHLWIQENADHVICDNCMANMLSYGEIIESGGMFMDYESLSSGSADW